MSALLYIHGFLSSPKSYKANAVKCWLQENRQDIQYHCPLLPPFPEQAAAILQDIVAQHRSDPLYLMGSSMGGYWATWLAEQYNLPAVLINPLVDPGVFRDGYIDVPLKNYYEEQSYIFTAKHLAELLTYNVEVVARVKNYWVLVQAGDETLDHQLAVNKYSACQQTVEAGGNHSFVDFERWLPELIHFLDGFVK